jgi:hypothetical protein
MSSQIPAEKFTEPLLKCLDETFSQTHGFYLDRGTSLFDTLDSVSASEASQSSSPGTASIAAQVEHVRFYLDVLIDIIQTKQIVKVDWREIWQRVRQVNPEEWEEMKHRLKASHQQLLTTINSLETWDGEYDLGCALSILAHTAYHLGGIRQALGVIRAQNKPD